MEAEFDPTLISEVREYGDFDVEACFNCGSCAAVCSLNKDSAMFPRKSMRYARLGLKEPLLGSLDPWLCYYCGECSDTCPRQSEPGESMMTLRRYLIAKYDFTGISKLFYTNKFAEIIAIFIVQLLVLAGWYLLFGLIPNIGADTTAATLLPPHIIHWYFDVPMATILTILITSFAFNMYYKNVLSDKSVKAPLKLYFTRLWSTAFESATQWKFSECSGDSKTFFSKLSKGDYIYWLMHFLLMTGYASLFVGIVFFLNWFQTVEKYRLLHTVLYDYYASIGLVVSTGYFAFLRIKKTLQRSKFSHLSDWMFVILLFLTTITGIGIHFARVNQYSLSVYFYWYLVHMLVAIPMLVVEVPFSKWSHLAYRPLAIYFDNLKTSARNLNKGKRKTPIKEV